MDFIYDQAYNSSFYEKLESIQYNACLEITGEIRRTSSEKLYQDLRLESLKSTHWFRKLCRFYKIVNEKSPSYLFNLFPNLNRVRETRHSNNIPAIYARHNYFHNWLFPLTISEWNNLVCKIRNSRSLSMFEKKLLNFMQPCANSILNIQNQYGIKLLKRLRVGLSFLRDDKLRHCFQNTLNSYVTVVMILKQQHTLFSAAQVSILLDKPSGTLLEMSTSRFYFVARIS